MGSAVTHQEDIQQRGTLESGDDEPQQHAQQRRQTPQFGHEAMPLLYLAKGKEQVNFYVW